MSARSKKKLDIYVPDPTTNAILTTIFVAQCVGAVATCILGAFARLEQAQAILRRRSLSAAAPRRGAQECSRTLARCRRCNPRSR